MFTHTYFVVKTARGYVGPNALVADPRAACQFASLKAATRFAEAYIITASVEPRTVTVA